MIVTITEMISFINLRFLSESAFEEYTNAECLHKTKFRCSLPHEQIEFARVQTGLVIMFAR
jgi:hypothetical protein